MENPRHERKIRLKISEESERARRLFIKCRALPSPKNRTSHCVVCCCCWSWVGCMMFFLFEPECYKQKSKTAKQSAAKGEQKTPTESSLNRFGFPHTSLALTLFTLLARSLLVAISAGWNQMGMFPCAIYGALGHGWAQMIVHKFHFYFLFLFN
jgi:hypothetical protein